MATFYNQATLSYNNTVTNSNIVTGEIVETLSIVKTALDPTYTADDILAYVISIVNTGDTAYTGLTVTDDLGAYVFDRKRKLVPLAYVEGSVHYYVDGVLQPAPEVTAEDDTVVFSGITVPANGNTLIIYEAEVTAFAPLGEDQSITNTATLGGTCIAEELSASATTRASTEPELTISKSISPSEVEKNGTLTYSFLIRNSGADAADASDNVSLTDIFDPVLTDISVTLDGVPFPESNYSYNETTGRFVTDPGTITVPAADFVQNHRTGEWVSNPGSTVLVISGTV